MNRFIIISILALLVSCREHRDLGKSNLNLIPAQFIQYQQADTGQTPYGVLVNRTEATSRKPFELVDLVIYKKADGTVVFTDQLVNGKLIWISTNILKLTYTPGNITKNQLLETPNYLIDLNSGKKIITKKTDQLR
jgi:hypothetical protein